MRVFVDTVGAAPNAPKMTLLNERFIALLITIDRMNPDAPSSAPAMISTLLPIANPVAAEASPAYEFSSEMTTGMSAPPIGSTMKTPMSEREADHRVEDRRVARNEDQVHEHQRASRRRA